MQVPNKQTNVVSINADLYLVKAGIQFYGVGKSEMIKQTDFGLLFVLSGKGVLHIHDATYEVKKGDIVFVAEGATVSIKTLTSSSMRCAGVVFGGENAELYMEYAGFAKDEPIQRSNIPMEVYRAQIEEMMRVPSSRLADEMTRTGVLYTLFGTLVEAQRMERRGGVSGYDYPREVYVETAKEYIAHQYAYLKITDLAGYLGVNRSYLTMIFKKETGISPQEYLMMYRLEKATERLERSDDTLREIARSVGYADPFTFSKMFKSKYGVPPSVYRENYRKKEGKDESGTAKV